MENESGVGEWRMKAGDGGVENESGGGEWRWVVETAVKRNQ